MCRLTANGHTNYEPNLTYELSPIIQLNYSVGALMVEKRISVAVFLSSNTEIRMTGSGPLFCIILDQKPTTIRILTRQVRGTESNEELNNYLLHGFSWNLDVGNNAEKR